MAGKNIYNNTPVRNKKVGLPDPQANNGGVTAPSVVADNTAPAHKVVEMAQQSYALKHGGQLPPTQQTTPQTTAEIEPPMGADNQGGNPVVRHPNGDVANMNFFDGSNSAIGKYENLQPKQTGNGLATDFTNMPKQNDFVPQTGNGYANPTVGPTQSPYMGDVAETTQQPQSSFEGMQPANQNGWNPLVETSDVGYKGAPYDPSSYNSLSAALNGETPSSSQAPAFQKDDTKRDGGFFNWLKGLMPKSRPGKREGESDDDYDRRTTKNMQMVATLADAIRHMGNIVNTSKGAPLQVFNDPSTMLETGYQNRKAQRQKQDALDRDAAQKQNEMTLKQQAAEADRNYKLWLMGLKDDAAQLGKDKFEYQKEKDKATADAKAAKDERDFKYKQGRDKVKDAQTDRRLGIAEYNATHKGSGRSGKGGSGSGGKYWFEDKNGKMHYQTNKTMWEQEYYREYGKLPEGESTVSTSTKTIDYKTGQETTTTTRRKGSSVTSQAAASQNKAKEARKAKSSKPVGKTGNKGKSGKGWASGFKI